jgi:hypothetical protein
LVRWEECGEGDDLRSLADLDLTTLPNFKDGMQFLFLELAIIVVVLHFAHSESEFLKAGSRYCLIVDSNSTKERPPAKMLVFADLAQQVPSLLPRVVARGGKSHDISDLLIGDGLPSFGSLDE